MSKLKINIADEPRILVSAISNPYQVVLNMEGTSQSLSGIVSNDEFVFTTESNQEFKNAVGLLLDNRINFKVEY